VKQALMDNRWILDIPGGLTDLETRECIDLWLAIGAVDRAVDTPDQFLWPWSRSGTYTARSTYRMLTQGSCFHPLGRAIWRNNGTPKSKLFVWLAQQGRIWSLDRRFRHGIQDEERPCQVCLQEKETSEHILLQCVAAREVWHICRIKLGLDFEDPTRNCCFQDWWTRQRDRLRGREKKEFDALVCTVSYALWKNRNAWTFGEVGRQNNPMTVAELVTQEYNMLKMINRSQGIAPAPNTGVGGANNVGE
jgi:hypothetical protein